MPLFEFRCPTCRHDFELLMRGSDPAQCPRCGAANVEKLFSETASGAAARDLPIAASCPPGNAPCGPACCRLP
jgi:putative FmdB family regulatory protein